MTDEITTEPTPIRRRGPRKRKPTPRTKSTTRYGAPGGLIRTMQDELTARMGTHTCTQCHQPHSTTSKASVAREIGITTPTLDKFMRSGNAAGPTMDRIWTFLRTEAKQGQGGRAKN